MTSRVLSQSCFSVWNFDFSPIFEGAKKNAKTCFMLNMSVPIEGGNVREIMAMWDKDVCIGKQGTRYQDSYCEISIVRVSDNMFSLRYESDIWYMKYTIWQSMNTDSQYSPKGFDVVRDQVSCTNNLTILSEFKVLNIFKRRV